MMDYKFVGGLIRKSNLEFADFRQKLVDLLSWYVKDSYFLNATDSRVHHLVLLLLDTERGCIEVKPIEGKHCVVGDSDSITLIGILNEVRPIIAGQIRQELGMKYSGFGNHLRFPLLPPITSMMMDDELEEKHQFGLKAVGKFRPFQLDLSLSLNHMNTTRSSDLMIYESISSSFMAGILQYQSVLPTSYGLSSSTRSCRLTTLNDIAIFAYVAADLGCLTVKVWSIVNKKMLSRKSIFGGESQGGMSAVDSIQRCDHLVSLMCVAASRDYRLLTIDIRKRSVRCLVIDDHKTFTPVAVGQILYVFENFDRVEVYAIEESGAAKKKIRSVSVTAIGFICDTLGIYHNNKGLLVVFNFFEMSIMIIDGQTDFTLICQLPSSIPRDQFHLSYKTQTLFDSNSKSIICILRHTVWRLDLSTILTNFS